MRKMYRVSNMMNKNNEPCGCFYYFTNMDNAVKALQEFETAITTVPHCPDTKKSDDWYS